MVVCRFFTGEDGEAKPNNGWNSNCGVDGLGCDDPTEPCTCHYKPEEKENE